MYEEIPQSFQLRSNDPRQFPIDLRIGLLSLFRVRGAIHFDDPDGGRFQPLARECDLRND